jgi:tRNA1(Val) A37 N6-methylase TrmN6
METAHMALIFPRIAQNFIKNGYFPTDTETLACIAAALDAPPGPVRVIDPCCGEGAALLSIADHLLSCGAAVNTFGVELDEERAWHAKTVLATVAHADVHEVRITDRSFGLLFLNPPYGDLVADAADTGDRRQGRLRHEKIFCKRTFNLLQPGGILVLIVPFYVLDDELSSFIARHFEDVTVHMAPEQQFKQCVVLGRKRRPAAPDARIVKRLLAFAAGDDQLELPRRWPTAPYEVPAARPADDFTFTIVRLDARQLYAELQAGLARHSLWPRFDLQMKPRLGDMRPPLRAMTDWHLALALAAGQLSGVVTSSAGRRLLVKGRTHKVKDTQVLTETGDDGSVTETRVLVDRFVTVIRGVDLTPGPTLGQVVTIQ